MVLTVPDCLTVQMPQTWDRVPSRVLDCKKIGPGVDDVPVQSDGWNLLRTAPVQTLFLCGEGGRCSD